MTELFPAINGHFEDNAGMYGAFTAISIDRNQRQQQQIGRESLQEHKARRAIEEKTLAAIQKSHATEEKRLQIEQARLRIEECRRKEEQIEKAQKEILAERQKNARLCMTAINKEIDILENSLETI